MCNKVTERLAKIFRDILAETFQYFGKGLRLRAGSILVVIALILVGSAAVLN